MYMSAKEIAQEIRETLKKEFPTSKGWKFSVTKSGGRSIKVSLMAAPVNYPALLGQEDRSYANVFQGVEIPELKRIWEIIEKRNWNNSDPMTDYFDVNFYSHFQIGKWDKPFVHNKK